MLKLLLLTFLLSMQSLYAQDLSEDLGFLETQNTHGMPFNVPLFVDLMGNVQIMNNNGMEGTTLYPMGHLTYKWNSSLYIRPIQREQFSFSQQRSDLGWIEVKRKRWEVGLGIGANVATGISVGLAPYKGARQVMIRYKKSQDEVTPNPKLPQELRDMENWNPGDNGSFQRYGGVHMQVGANFFGANALNAGITIQSLWSLLIKKLPGDKIQIAVAEENLNKRRLQSGVPIINAKLHWFNGKRVTLHFILDLKDPAHETLYRQALKGQLHKLQKVLPEKAQKTEWKGTERLGYIGIPGVAGRHSQRSNYDMIFDGEEDVLDIKSRRNSGFLLPLRNHHKMVYQTDDALILFWYSEMNKATEKILSEKFLTPGKILGAKGFENTLPPGTVVGATLSQMGMSFTREKRQRKIHRQLLKWMSEKWEKVRDSLGFLMIEEPALIHSYIKTIKSQKKLYFKFLNEKYQSMEGAATIEIQDGTAPGAGAN